MEAPTRSRYEAKKSVLTERVTVQSGDVERAVEQTGPDTAKALREHSHRSSPDQPSTFPREEGQKPVSAGTASPGPALLPVVRPLPTRDRHSRRDASPQDRLVREAL